MGSTLNLATELQSADWKQKVESLGLNWLVIHTPEKWRDYRNIDAIIAVRSFDRSNYLAKPASKLFNAWIAGVPAILGNDSAFESERKSSLDYVKVSTVDETFEALQQLRNSQSLRQKMIENGKRRSQEIQSSTLAKQWCDFLHDVAIPSYKSWCKQSNLGRNCFLWGRSLGFKAKQFSGTL